MGGSGSGWVLWSGVWGLPGCGGDVFDDGVSGGGDANAGDARLKPWWRSVGFWLGLWGLVFLVWMWADSFSRASYVGTVERVNYSSGSVPFAPWVVTLEGGSVAYQQMRLTDAPAGAALVARWPTGKWRGTALGGASMGGWGSSVSKVETWWPLLFEHRR